MKEKRVYHITRSMLINVDEHLGDVYMPDFLCVPELLNGYRPGSDDDHWDAVTSEKHTDGIFDSYLVGIYTTIENHELLEKEDHITRIDNL